MTEVTCTQNAPSPPSRDLALVIRAHPPRLVPLRGRTVSIGRAESNDVALDDPFVSSLHCRIEERHGAYLVQDLGSRNGTTINGVAIQEGPLWSGALLGVGGEAFLCVDRLTQGSLSGGESGLVGTSPVMARLRAELACFALRSAPVLLMGESGTGKELAAHDVHRLSERARGPMVSINCGALTAELALSELFGHERGAFTGASLQHRGAFEQARGGTLFLDEVGELSPRLQASLLRTLETGTIRRIGSERELSVDVRVVAATNRDLLEAARGGSFRQDLYHRLAVLCVQLPPLRSRLADIPELARALLTRAAAPQELDEAALSTLGRYRWPGNVRELRNVLERACALARGPVITPWEIRFDRSDEGEAHREEDLLALVDRHSGNVAAAARSLGLSRTTLRDRLNRLRQG